MNSRVDMITCVQHDKQEPSDRPLSFGLIKRLFRYTRPYRAKRNLLLVLVVIRSIQLPLLAWVIGAVIGGPVATFSMKGIALGAAGYAALAGLTQLVLRYRSRLALELGESVVADIRKDMFQHLQTLPMSFYQKTRLGRIISRFTSDTESVRVGVQNVLFVSLVHLGQMLVAAGLMIWYDPILFLVVAAMGPVIWAINTYFRRRLSEVYRAVQESFSRVTATLAARIRVKPQISNIS